MIGQFQDKDLPQNIPTFVHFFSLQNRQLRLSGVMLQFSPSEQLLMILK